MSTYDGTAEPRTDTDAVDVDDIGAHHGVEVVDTERGASYEAELCDGVIDTSLLRPGRGFRASAAAAPASTSVGVVGWLLKVNIDDGEGDTWEGDNV